MNYHANQFCLRSKRKDYFYLICNKFCTVRANRYFVFSCYWRHNACAHAVLKETQHWYLFYIKHVDITLSCQLKRICTLFLRKHVKARRSMVEGNIGHPCNDQTQLVSFKSLYSVDSVNLYLATVILFYFACARPTLNFFLSGLRAFLSIQNYLCADFNPKRTTCNDQTHRCPLSQPSGTKSL